jgi:hypothetical protein
MVHVMGNFKLRNDAVGTTVLTAYMTNPAAIAAATRALSTTIAAAPNTVGKQWEDAAAGGGGGGDASWSQPLPNGYTEGQAGWILDNVNTVVENFNLQLQAILARSYQAGVVGVPTAASSGDVLTFFAGTDYDDIKFSLGAQWSSYLSEATAEVWFTVKSTPRQKTAMLEVECAIDDEVGGLVSMDLTSEQLSIDAGSFFWQIQIRNTTLPIEKRVVLEGTVYVKPTFKG